MISISLCMIVKDEEQVLQRCLDSIKDVVDEIIIVDTGSTDKTKEIAYTFSDKVFDYKWCDDFSLARNFSFSKAKSDYLMWIDADDVLLEKDKENLFALKRNLSSDTSVVMMKYNTNFDTEGKATFTYFRERLLRRKDNFQWNGFIHEVITPKGKVEYSEIAITHKKEKVSNPRRNLEIYIKKLQEGVLFTPRDIFYYARELYYQKEYESAILEFQNFINISQGWLENKIAACQFLAYCYDYLEKKTEALSWLFYSFIYDIPRAEICCDIGKYFIEMKNYQNAIYWYNIATTCKREDTSGAFILPDCYDYIPYIQMCVCYDALKDYTTANFYNELAGTCKPKEASYLHNKKYFEQRIR